MDLDGVEDVPEELRPTSIRRRLMRTVGAWLAAAGLSLVAGAGAALLLHREGPVQPLVGPDLALALGVLGALVLVKGLLTALIAESLV